MTVSVWQLQCERLCARMPNPVELIDATGACVRGPRIDGDVPVADAPGLTHLENATVVTIPTHCLPSLAIDQTVTVKDAADVSTRYKVRDIRKIGDGLLRKCYLVEV